RIFEEAASNELWRGMACVLTLAVIEGDKVTVGHVGDSRLYLTWNGAIRKLTPDHSPVGEREDAGELTEAEAMAHPRRHEVFRDVGSRRRYPFMQRRPERSPDFIRDPGDHRRLRRRSGARGWRAGGCRECRGWR